MNKATDVAIYIINLINAREGFISNLKLQKILYYVQAAFLSQRQEPCFPEAILRWRHGPVVRSVYNQFSIHGSSQIPPQRTVSKIVFEDGRLKLSTVEFDRNIICANDQRIIDAVVNALIDYDPWYLVERTHEEDPWKNLENYDEEITQASIAAYFSTPDTQRRIYGNFDN